MSDEKNRGIYKKYEVKKISNPTKKLDCIVLEFDDPIARRGIEAWAHEMQKEGYHKVAAQCFMKILDIESPGSVT